MQLCGFEIRDNDDGVPVWSNQGTGWSLKGTRLDMAAGFSKVSM